MKSDSLRSTVFLGITLLGFSVGGACSEGGEGSRPVSPEEIARGLAELRAAVGEESRYRVTSGEIKGIRVGEPREAVARRLLRQGHRQVTPALAESAVIRVGDSVEPLRGAERIVLGSGDMRIDFDGDVVSDVWSTDEWKDQARTAVTVGESRDRVLAVLPDLMRSIRVETAHATVLLREGDLAEALNDPGNELWKYDRWELNLLRPDGVWALTLEFSAGVLDAVSVVHSPQSLP